MRLLLLTALLNIGALAQSSGSSASRSSSRSVSASASASRSSISQSRSLRSSASMSASRGASSTSSSFASSALSSSQSFDALPTTSAVSTSTSSESASSSSSSAIATLTTTIFVPVSPSGDGSVATATDGGVQQVVVIIDGLGQTLSTSVITPLTTTQALSTITVSDDETLATSIPTSATLSNGASISTSSVVVVVDGQGNIIVGPDGQTMTRERRTTTRQILVTLYPTYTGTPAGSDGGPQLVTGNDAGIKTPAAMLSLGFATLFFGLTLL